MRQVDVSRQVGTVPRLLGRSFAGGRIRKEKKTRMQSKTEKRSDQTSQSVSQSVKWF